MEKLPFMATENIMMEAVKRGGNRQELHEALRVHSQAAATEVKRNGKPNDLIQRIAADPLFGLTENEIKMQLAPEKYIGRSVSQVDEFLSETIKPLLNRYDVKDVVSKLSV